MIRVGERLRPYWWVLVVVWATTAIGITTIAPNYTDVQVARDTVAVRAAVPVGDVGAYRLGAGLDMLFCLAYASLALVSLSVMERWTGWVRSVGVLGCWLIVGGAVADEIENTLVLVNLGRRDAVENSLLDVMVSVGAVKWALVLGGLLLVLVARLGRWVGGRPVIDTPAL